MRKIFSLFLTSIILCICCLSVSANEVDIHDDIIEHRVILSDGEIISFENVDEANDFILSTNPESLLTFSGSEQPSINQNDSIITPRYVACIVGPGACNSVVIREDAYMNIFGKIFKWKYTYGCSKCRTVHYTTEEWL